VRRFLRIFPIYYLTIAALFLLGAKTGTNIRESVGYFLTYTANFYFFSLGKWDGLLSHLWSLSVEEQFYIFWPWIMLYANRKLVLPFIITSIFISVGAKLLLLQTTLGNILTFSCLDGFGCGALLAWFIVYKPAFLKKLYWPALAALIIGCTLQVIRVLTHSKMILLPPRTLASICTCAIMISILLKKEYRPFLPAFILDNKALIFLGKISYGIYLYHTSVSYFGKVWLTNINAKIFSALSEDFNFFLLRIEYFCLLVLFSFLSWKLIEEPILKLKRKFEYQSNGSKHFLRKVVRMQPVEKTT